MSHSIAHPQIDEAWPGDFGRGAEVGQVEPGDDLGGDFARRPAEPFCQRHGHVRLVVAELGILAAANEFDHFGRIIDHAGQCRMESLFQNGKDAHVGP